jgi:hypothetical protein
MKAIFKNCNIVIVSSGDSHKVIEDSFSSYYQTGKALKNDGTTSPINGFNTFFKIPFEAGTIINLDISLTFAGDYTPYVLYDSNENVVSYGDKISGKIALLVPNYDGYISICCASRSEFTMYTKNVNFETINSDLYLKKRTALKNDGTTVSVGGWFTIEKIPVLQGDKLIFSLSSLDAPTGSYCSWALMDSNSAVYSYGAEANIVDREVVIQQNGYFSLAFENPDFFAAYADIEQ